MWLRWDRLLRWWWLRPRLAVPRSQRGRHWPRLRKIVSRTAVCQARILLRSDWEDIPWSLPKHSSSALHIVRRLAGCSLSRYGELD